MASVALIGPDGAGKTAIALMLQKMAPLPIKYLYMGVNIGASNVALPTSRLADYVKRWLDNKSASPRQGAPSASAPNMGARRLVRWLRAAARLVNRLADEWYRQVVSWSYQVRGYLVVYDRYFVFDFASNPTSGEPESLSSRLHRRWLARLYPRPDLVIYLDAPAKVLFARKGEWTVEQLEKKRQAFILQGGQISNLVQVDATQPLEKVYAEVAKHIMRLWKTRHRPLCSLNHMEA